MCAQSFYDTLTQEFDEAQADHYFSESGWAAGNSPSEVAGRDETRKESIANYLELKPWEQNLLDHARLENVIVVPADLFEDLVIVAEEYAAVQKEERENTLVSKSPSYKHSRIRVQLSRPLTVAESEKFQTDHHIVGGRLNTSRRQDDGFLFKLRVSPNGTHVWVDADLPSRPLFDVVAAALDQHFVNVYPTAVRTFTEYHA